MSQELKFIALVVLAFCVAEAAQAQGKHMPVRTREIPDTESGRPAASASRAFKGRLLIYGPQSLPVTPPAEHVAPAPAQADTKPAAPDPVAAPAPAPSVAAPTPAPVIVPVKPAQAPVAVPLPAPVASPTPPPEPKPAPVAAPTPALEPKPAPVVTAPPPSPAVPVAPAPAVVAAPEPKREPIVRPEALSPPPAAAARPAAPRQDVALAAPASAATTADAPVPIDMKLIESIFTCLAPGLPQDWKRAWVEITDPGGGKEKVSKFRYTNLRNDDVGEALVPCNAPELTRRIAGLSDKLPPERRKWNRALLVIESDGEYEMSYEYPQ